MLRVILCATSLAVVTGAMSQTVTTDWYQAAKLSKQTRKPIMMQFTGSDWCGWCVRLDNEVFKTREFRNWAKANVIWLVVDLPRKKALPKAQAKQNEALVARYNVQGFPTILFTDHTGEVRGELGYVEGGAGAWLKEANAQLGKG